MSAESPMPAQDNEGQQTGTLNQVIFDAISRFQAQKVFPDKDEVYFLVNAIDDSLKALPTNPFETQSILLEEATFDPYETAFYLGEQLLSLADDHETITKEQIAHNISTSLVWLHINDSRPDITEEDEYRWERD